MSPRNGTTPSSQTKEQNEESVFVVSARLDALSIFDQEEVGFDTPVTGIVTLLTTAHLVSQAMKTMRYKDGVENVGPSGVRVLPLAAGINAGGHYFRYF